MPASSSVTHFDVALKQGSPMGGVGGRLESKKERALHSNLSNHTTATVPTEMNALWADLPVSKFGRFFLLSASNWEVPERSPVTAGADASSPRPLSWTVARFPGWSHH